MSDPRPRFVFLDTEATGLDHTKHELTEVAWIVRFGDGSQIERQYFPEHTIDGATPEALEITQYAERIATQPRSPASEWLIQFLEDAEGAFLVGAVPDFDAKHLERMCRKLDLTPTWDHHLLDVETLALPLIAGEPDGPRSLARTCRALGLEHDKDQAHGALYDAQQAMRVFDRVWELMAAIRAGDQPLPDPVPRTVPEEDNGTDTASEKAADDLPAAGDRADDADARGIGQAPPPGQATATGA
jgi:DNA polymerase III epsilon subunit-like protein